MVFNLKSSCNFQRYNHFIPELKLNMSTTKPKEKLETEANSLSVKLLKTLGGEATRDSSKKVITNLKDLSNRIKLANKQHQNKHPNKTLAEEWIREEGVDLTVVKQQAIFTKEEQKKISIRMPMIVEEQPTPLQPVLKDLPFQQFLPKVEENFAYRAIFQSLCLQPKSQNKITARETHMKKIVKGHISRLCEHFEPTKSIEQYKKSEKASDTGTIKAYQDIVCQSEFDVLPEMIFRRFQQDDHYSKTWVQLLYYQVEMAKQIFVESVSQNDKSQFKIYLSAVSLEQLSKIYKTILKKDKASLIGKYNLQQSHSMAEDQWRQLYFTLRTDQKVNFLDQCYNKHPDLAPIYQRFFNHIQSFEKAPIQITDIALNTHMNFFERILKLVAEGQYESIFTHLHPSLQALQQPWLILMTVEFRQIRLQRKNHLKEATTKYYKSLSQKIFVEEEYDEQAIMHLIVGLLSLGNFKQIFTLYDKLGEFLNNNPLYIDLAHIFLLLAANPELLLCQISDNQASELLRRCLVQILAYLKFLKHKKLPSLKAYISLFLEIMANIQKFNNRFAFYQIIQSLTNGMLTKLEDLKLINKQKLSALSQHSKVVYRFQRALIRNIHPINEEQFVSLAQFCTSINQFQLREQTLIKLIIFNYIQTDKEEKDIQKGAYGTTVKKSSAALNNNVTKAQMFLERQMSQEKRSILYFLINLKDLRSAIINRRKDILRQQEKKFTEYRQHFEDIFEYLIQMDPSCKQGLLNIYLLYIQRLQQMYRLITLSNANLEKFHNQRFNLAKDLNLLKRKYPGLYGEAFGRVMELLCR